MWADACHGEFLADRASNGSDVLEAHRVDARDRGIGVDVVAMDDRLRCRIARHRSGVLERENPASCRIGARSLELFLTGTVAAQLVDDLAHPCVGLQALGGVESRAKLEDRGIREAVVNRPH